MSAMRRITCRLANRTMCHDPLRLSIAVRYTGRGHGNARGATDPSARHGTSLRHAGVRAAIRAHRSPRPPLPPSQLSSEPRPSVRACVRAQALHNLQWPPVTGRKLFVNFATAEDMDAARATGASDLRQPPPPRLAGRVPSPPRRPRAPSPPRRTEGAQWPVRRGARQRGGVHAVLVRRAVDPSPWRGRSP